MAYEHQPFISPDNWLYQPADTTLPRWTQTAIGLMKSTLVILIEAAVAIVILLTVEFLEAGDD